MYDKCTADKYGLGLLCHEEKRSGNTGIVNTVINDCR